MPGMSSGEQEARIKETCRLIRLARSYWDAHNNHACRTHRDKAVILYESLAREERERVPQVLRVWLRFRREKYFGPHRTPPGSARAKAGSRQPGPGSRPRRGKG